MTRAMGLLVTVVTLASLAGCGTEVGRVPFSGEGTAAATIPLKAGDVNFWTDLDIVYQGSAALSYDVVLSQGGSQVARATCDPLGHLPVKTSWTETNIGASHSRRGSGKMTCTATLPSGGSTLVTAKLAFSSRPATVTLKKADLALRQ